MPFEEVDDDLDLEELFKNVKIPEKNMYISDEDKAVELLVQLIRNQSDSSIYFKDKMERKINYLFSLFSEVTIEDEMILYEKFMDLCSRLSARYKIKKLQDKVVVSFGGKVSAGKSRFINSISGIGDILPVNQKTTTAIPTYIIKSMDEEIYANSIYGYSTQISCEALNAMAHEFDSVYGIGFSPFVDSIIYESEKYSLPDSVALLDTPGYTKYDGENDSKRIITDREKAFEQISESDYLIWLIDIDNGGITEDDIEFIESLRIKTPILIVFTKADLKSESDIIQILKGAKETIDRTPIDCFGITAYSSDLKKEFNNDLIKQFFDKTITGNIKNNDIINEFENTEIKMRESIVKSINTSKNDAIALFSYISNSEKIIEISSLTKLWGKSNQNGYILNKLLKRYDEIISEINSEIREYFKEGEK